jgi:hypothetical protein
LIRQLMQVACQNGGHCGTAMVWLEALRCAWVAQASDATANARE